MAHPLDGVRLKLDRAEEHIKTFREERDAYLARHISGITFEDDEEFRHMFFVVHEPPPGRFSTILGDCIHNIRSSLDHLAWQLVLANPPNQPTRDTAFPIFSSKDLYRKNATNRIKGMRPEAVALIEGLQPYCGGQSPLNHPLWFLYELDNADKHRTLNLTQSKVFPVRAWITTKESGEAGIAPAWIASGIVHDGAKIASFRRSDYLPEDYVKMQASGVVAITLQDAGLWGQKDVLDLTEKARDFVRSELLPGFEPFFDLTP